MDSHLLNQRWFIWCIGRGRPHSSPKTDIGQFQSKEYIAREFIAFILFPTHTKLMYCENEITYFLYFFSSSCGLIKVPNSIDSISQLIHTKDIEMLYNRSLPYLEYYLFTAALFFFFTNTLTVLIMLDCSWHLLCFALEWC